MNSNEHIAKTREEMAIILALKEVLENGMPISKAAEYVKSEACIKSAKQYLKMLNEI